MTAMWWFGIILAVLGALMPGEAREPMARRVAGVGLLLLLLNFMGSLT